MYNTEKNGPSSNPDSNIPRSAQCVLDLEERDNSNHKKAKYYYGNRTASLIENKLKLEKCNHCTIDRLSINRRLSLLDTLLEDMTLDRELCDWICRKIKEVRNPSRFQRETDRVPGTIKRNRRKEFNN